MVLDVSKVRVWGRQLIPRETARCFGDKTEGPWSLSWTGSQTTVMNRTLQLGAACFNKDILFQLLTSRNISV